jgi:hypothetical protein
MAPGTGIKIIDKDTGVSLALVVTIVVGMILIAGMFMSIEKRLMSIEMQSGDRWTATMQAKFAHDLEAQNKELNLTVPDCYSIQKSMYPSPITSHQGAFSGSVYALDVRDAAQ